MPHKHNGFEMSNKFKGVYKGIIGMPMSEIEERFRKHGKKLYHVDFAKIVRIMYEEQSLAQKEELFKRSQKETYCSGGLPELVV